MASLHLGWPPAEYVFKPAVAALACVLALGVANSSADVAPAGAIGTIAVAQQTGRVLVGIDGARRGSWLWRSDDHGASWHAATGLGSSTGVSAVAFAPSTPSVAYAGTLTSRSSGGLGTGFFSSSDGGRSWRARTWKATVGIFGRQLPATIDTIVVDPQRPQTVYAVTHGILRRSLNGGATWAVARNGLPATRDITSPRTQQLAVGRGGTLYYATGSTSGTGQVYRSVNRAASWQPAGSGLPSVVPGWPLIALAGDATRSGVIYATTGRGLFMTSDSGRSWRKTLTDPSLAVVTATSAAGAPVVVVDSQPRALVRRVGASSVWSRLGQPPGGFTGFVLDPGDAGQMYAAAYRENDPTLSACAALWATTNAGATWTAVGGTLPLVRRNC